MKDLIKTSFLFYIIIFNCNSAYSSTEIYFRAEQGMLPDLENNYEVTYSSENYQIVRKEPSGNNSDLVLNVFALDEESPAYDYIDGVNEFTLSGPGGKFAGVGHYELVRNIHKEYHYAGFAYPSSCNKGKGEVDIYEVQHDSNDVITSLAADLYYRCGQQYNRTFVKIRYNSDIPLHLPTAHANAGTDTTAEINETVTLNGSQSYTDNQEIVSYHWRQVGGEPIPISGVNSAIASIVVPADREEFSIYEFQLEVVDNQQNSSLDRVLVTIGNQQPTFRRTLYRQGTNFRWQETLEDYTLSLDYLTIKTSGQRGWEFYNTEDGGFDLMVVFSGSNFDIYENIELGGQIFAQRINHAPHLPEMSHYGGCEYYWKESQKSFYNVLDKEYSESGELKRFAIDYLDHCDETYRLKIIGKIRYNSYAPEITNYPHALAGPDRKVISYDRTFLYGMFSYSDESFITSYQWEQISGPNVDIENANSPVATVNKNILITGEVTVVFELTVVNGKGKSSKDRVKVTFPALNEKVTHAYYANSYYSRENEFFTNYRVGRDAASIEISDNLYHNNGELLGYQILDFGGFGASISAGEGLLLKEGDYIGEGFEMKLDEMNHSNIESACESADYSSELSIKKIQRNNNEIINEFAADYTITPCNQAGFPDKGKIRFNTDVPIGLEFLKVDAGDDLIVYEGDQIDLVASVQHDKPIYTEWRVAYGPNLLYRHTIWGKTRYGPIQSVVAPSIPTGEIRNMVFHVRVWDENGAWGEDYVAVQIFDKDNELDFVEASEFIDTPFVVNFEGYPTFGIRNAETTGNFIELKYSSETVHQDQITPVIEILSEIRHSSELFVKSENTNSLRLYALTIANGWQFIDNVNLLITDIADGWSKVYVFLEPSIYNLNENSIDMIVKFAIIESNAGGDTGGSDTGGSDTGGDNIGGGGSFPLFSLLMIIGLNSIRKRKISFKL